LLLVHIQSHGVGYNQIFHWPALFTLT